MTSELKGTIEPCGCNSDPLGDLARTAKLVADARSGGGAVLYIDGGSTLYTDPSLAKPLIPQERLKASLLREQLSASLKADAIGLGPFDLALGNELTNPRHAINLDPKAGVPLAKPVIVTAGAIKVGVFGVIAPQALSAFKISATDPTAAAQAAIKQLRTDGADVVIAILHMVRSEAATLARKAPGIDFALVGQNLPEPDHVADEPIEAGHSWLVEPANRGQVVSRLDITLRGTGEGFADAIGEARATRELAEMPAAIEKLEAELASFRADPNAEPAFLASKEKTIATLKQRRQKLTASPLEIPASGSYFTLSQVRIAKALACEPSIVAAKAAYDLAAARANLAELGNVKPAAPAKGEAGYVGVQECSTCHGKAVKMWQSTKHFEAWETLEKVGKQLDLSCIYCHVSGFDKLGGANLAFNEHLRDVQCETCHGPGSKHVEADGKGHIVLTPEASLCQGCHNEEHSDTFDFKPYLRDITGDGHGEEFRKTLGDGATGSELRAAALAKAGSAIGANCPK